MTSEGTTTLVVRHVAQILPNSDAKYKSSLRKRSLEQPMATGRRRRRSQVAQQRSRPRAPPNSEQARCKLGQGRPREEDRFSGSTLPFW